MAVYTRLQKEEIEKILSDYNLTLKNFYMIKTGILNTNYYIECIEGKFVLREFEGGRKYFEENQELEFLLELKDIVPCCTPLQTTSGNNYIVYKNKMIALFYFIMGEPIKSFNEAYLKEILGNSEQIEIRRSEVANHFDVVPSQINYVIKTRFTLQNGYLVQSKRGGYIRIERINLLDDVDVLDMLINAIGDSISERDAFDVIRTLYEEKVITRREGDLMMVMVAKQTLKLDSRVKENQLRARVLTSLLNRLRFES